jgi:hypothetical protein
VEWRDPARHPAGLQGRDRYRRRAGRTALNGPEDVPNVKAIQEQYKLQPLSAFLGQPAPPPAPALTFPVYDKAKTETHDFIGYLNFFLQFAEPPYPAEVGIRQQFERIGIRPGAPWDASKVDPQTLAVIDIRNELEPIRLEQMGNALERSLLFPIERRGLDRLVRRRMRTSS